jgi:hypothetical protein
MKKYIKENPMTFLTIITIFCSLYLIWFYYIDGIYINKTFTFDYDIQNIPTEYNQYKLGDMVRLKVSFCKNRPSSSYLNWSIVDGRVMFFPKTEIHELPVGCYKNKIIDLYEIPYADYLKNDTIHFEGIGTVLLSSGREVKYNYRTQNFKILP